MKLLLKNVIVRCMNYFLNRGIQNGKYKYETGRQNNQIDMSIHNT